MKLKQIKQAYNNKQLTALVDSLLTAFDTPKVYSEDPSVAIEKIAENLGINEIVYIPGEELEGHHAIFENSVLKINKDESRTKQVFSIAHEIGHIVLGHIDITAEYKVARHGTSKINELYEKIMAEDIICIPQLHKVIEDRLADFFAASLLVPINRFLLWEDREDIEIANAFGVEEKCIRERRNEINAILPELVSNTQAVG